MTSTQDRTSDLPERIIRVAECCEITGLSRVSLWRLERQNEFPRRVRITSYAIGWRLSEVMAWLATRPRHTYSAKAEAPAPAPEAA